MDRIKALTLLKKSEFIIKFWISYGVIVEKFFIKPKEKAKVMLEGKKTYIGIIIAMLPVLSGFFGYDVNSGIAEEAVMAIDEAMVIIGGLIATLGRVFTKK